MAGIADIIARLPELNLTDLRAVQAALDIELIKHLSIDEDLYFLVFNITGEKPIAVGRFATSTLGTQWRKNQPAFDNLIEKLIKGKTIRQVTLRALKRFLLEIIIDYIKEKGMSLSMKSVCDQLGNAQYIFDLAFPGYLSSGMGTLIIKQLEGNHG